MSCFFIAEWSPSLWADQGFHHTAFPQWAPSVERKRPCAEVKENMPFMPLPISCNTRSSMCVLIINQIPDSAPPNKELVLQHVSHKVTEAERYADDSMPNAITWLKHWQTTSRKHSALNSNTFVFVRESESTAFQCIVFSHVTNSITNTSVFNAPHQRFLSFGSTLCVL